MLRLTGTLTLLSSIARPYPPLRHRHVHCTSIALTLALERLCTGAGHLRSLFVAGARCIGWHIVARLAWALHGGTCEHWHMGTSLGLGHSGDGTGAEARPLALHRHVCHGTGATARPRFARPRLTQRSRRWSTSGTYLWGVPSPPRQALRLAEPRVLGPAPGPRGADEH